MERLVGQVLAILEYNALADTAGGDRNVSAMTPPTMMMPEAWMTRRREWCDRMLHDPSLEVHFLWRILIRLSTLGDNDVSDLSEGVWLAIRRIAGPSTESALRLLLKNEHRRWVSWKSKGCPRMERSWSVREEQDTLSTTEDPIDETVPAWYPTPASDHQLNREGVHDSGQGESRLAVLDTILSDVSRPMENVADTKQKLRDEFGDAYQWHILRLIHGKHFERFMQFVEQDQPLESFLCTNPARSP